MVSFAIGIVVGLSLSASGRAKLISAFQLVSDKIKNIFKK
jgi:hypothetical protein